MTIYFSNPAPAEGFDLRGITLFGASAKPSPGAFGRFGSGLKYAIAGTLRLGGTLRLQVPDPTPADGQDILLFEFECQENSFRGKPIREIWMTQRDSQTGEICGSTLLPFTTELGSHWEPWMIFREFYCNMRDEAGEMALAGEIAPGAVCFGVSCPEIEEIAEEGKFQEHFLSGRASPEYELPGLEVFAGASPGVFYQGVKVYSHHRAFAHTYNLTGTLALTEDRTATRWDALGAIVRALGAASEAEGELVAEAMLTEGQGESEFDWDQLTEPTETVKDLLVSLYHNKKLSASARRYSRSHYETEITPRIAPLSAGEAEMLSEVRQVLSRAGFAVPNLVFKSVDVGDYDFQMVWGGKIFLSPKSFQLKPNYWTEPREPRLRIAQALIEGIAQGENRRAEHLMVEAIARGAGAKGWGEAEPSSDEELAQAVPEPFGEAPDDNIPF